MMSFCAKTVNTFLGIPLPAHPDDSSFPSACKCLSSINEWGLTCNDCQKPSIIKPDPESKRSSSSGLGFLDDSGVDSNDGLSSCTESLGCESSDQTTGEEEIVEMMRRSRLNPTVRRKSSERVREKRFPPPLSSLNPNGHPNFFFKSVRKNGRLELTEVKINRPEIFQASREDGRLRLQLIKPDPEPEPKMEILSEPEEIEEGSCHRDDVRWMFLISNGGDEFRRCQEVVSNKHHQRYHYHQIPLWNHA